MSARIAAFLLASSVIACGALTGCAADAVDDEELVADDGDGTSEDAIVSERQLMGNELADKTINLTFDDGPGPRTKELADFLGAEGVKATFFINGKNVPGRQAAIDAIIGRGHLLANHTHNHLQLTRQSSGTIVKEVADTDAIIVAAQPQGPFLVRAPFGAWNGSTARAINGSSMKKYVGSVFWDVGGALTSTAAADWDCWGKGVSVQRCGDLYLNEIRNKKRGIVLMHDVHGKTVDMMKNILPVLKAEGYRFVQCDQVPAVKRALGAVGETPSAGGCSSATLGRSVPENACVQSRSDQKWHRCEAGEWTSSSGANDPRCTGGKFPL
ncbi:MAG: polysaccharide deacetylase family protein [Labilithrix sp.]|nr:polysaccharide deacetylase family protein [Labilithrix sp.]